MFSISKESMCEDDGDTGEFDQSSDEMGGNEDAAINANDDGASDYVLDERDDADVFDENQESVDGEGDGDLSWYMWDDDIDQGRWDDDPSPYDGTYSEE